MATTKQLLAKAKSQLKTIQKTKDSISKSGGFTQSGLNKATSSLKSANRKLSGVSKAIGADKLMNDEPVVDIPKPPVPTNDFASILNLNNAGLADPQNGLNFQGSQFVYNPQESEGVNAVKEANANQANILSAVSQFLKPEANELENAYADTLEDSGLRAYERDRDRYASQLNAITADRDANILKLEGQGRGITDVIIGGQQAKINREAAIQALPVQAQLAAAQGAVDTAQRHLDTLFQIRSQDIASKNAYKTNLANSVMQFASQAQQNVLNARMADIATKNTQAQQNLAFVRQLQGQALDNGQNSLIPGLSAIDPSSATFEQDVARYTQQLRKPVSTTQKAPTLQNFGTSDAPDWRQYDYATGQWAPVSGVSGASNNQQASLLLGTSKQIDLIDNVMGSNAIDSTVGTSFLTRTPSGFFAKTGSALSLVGIPSLIGGAKDTLTGEKQNLIANVSQLTAKLTNQELINAKASGATYGALGVKEQQLLENASTKLNNWAIHKGGDPEAPVVGYNTSEKNFKKELDTIKYYTVLDYALTGGDPTEKGAIQQDDGTYWVVNSDGTYSQLKPY